MRIFLTAALFVWLSSARALAVCPTTCEVDRFFAVAPSLPPKTLIWRGKAMFQGLSRMSLDCPDRQDFDYLWIWEYALGRWGNLFKMNGAPAVLKVIDETRVDAGYATAQCSSFYRRLSGTKGFMAHYTDPSNRKYLKRCWADDEEIADVIRPGSTTLVSSGPTAVAVTGCEVDNFIGALQRQDMAIRSRVIAKLVRRVAKREKLDPVGAEYFYLRLAFRHRSFPHDGILDAVDAVARAQATPGICRFWLQVAGDGYFIDHYRQQEKRNLLLRCPENELPRAEIQDVLIP